MGQAYSVWVCCALDTGGVSGGVCFSPMLIFLSINANGLRDKAKVDVLSCQCSLLTFDVLLLQETHLTGSRGLTLSQPVGSASRSKSRSRKGSF